MNYKGKLPFVALILGMLVLFTQPFAFDNSLLFDLNAEQAAEEDWVEAEEGEGKLSFQFNIDDNHADISGASQPIVPSRQFYRSSAYFLSQATYGRVSLYLLHCALKVECC